MHLPRRRSCARLENELSAVVWSLAESWLGGTSPGSGSWSDGHVCYHVPFGSSNSFKPCFIECGCFLAQCIRSRVAAIDMFLWLCCVSDSECSAVEFEASCGNPSHFFFGRPSACEYAVCAALFAEDFQFMLCG